MIDMESTGIRISARFDSNLRQKYGLFAKLLLAVIGACEVAKNPHIFLTKSNQHIQKVIRYFYGTLNH